MTVHIVSYHPKSRHKHRWLKESAFSHKRKSKFKCTVGRYSYDLPEAANCTERPNPFPSVLVHPFEFSKGWVTSKVENALKLGKQRIAEKVA